MRMRRRRENDPIDEDAAKKDFVLHTTSSSALCALCRGSAVLSSGSRCSGHSPGTSPSVTEGLCLAVDPCLQMRRVTVAIDLERHDRGAHRSDMRSADLWQRLCLGVRARRARVEGSRRGAADIQHSSAECGARRRGAGISAEDRPRSLRHPDPGTYDRASSSPTTPAMKSAMAPVSSRSKTGRDVSATA